MNLLNSSQWIGISVIAALFVVVNLAPSLLAGFSGFKLPSFGAKPDDDALDLQAFRRLQARFVRLGCKQGQDAMETAGTHFLHGVGGP